MPSLCFLPFTFLMIIQSSIMRPCNRDQRSFIYHLQEKLGFSFLSFSFLLLVSWKFGTINRTRTVSFSRPLSACVFTFRLFFVRFLDGLINIPPSSRPIHTSSSCP
ncbi:hypothetical protein P170DRAFT_225937 [Aspergillus steynii IBT 23096]|uniref:Secreted protein n=1 Tax=Aspergillus steynii IBT 23096 TaxID=1392250 RepID=A0A2I2G1Y3_9EURO|nr:uncharacterized protein P170DRAFT_225937 [Aspergillus steynii IBT 23096]PLB46884.1 hypothetical protein P170DRAFT_225937 [Aspergillus steynii IBT 23096]